ncbi:MAG: DUF2227 family putative metal-binding protein [Aquificaceae bacterium]
MALGRTHDFVNLMALPFCLYYTPKEFYLPFTLGYLFGTFLLSPDLDLPKSKSSKRWRRLRLVWRPYQLLSKHRGLSHFPILGTALRFGYLFLIFLFSYFVLLGLSLRYIPSLQGLLFSFDPFSLISYVAEKEETFYFALGLVISEVFHIFLDLLTTYLKRFKIP